MKAPTIDEFNERRYQAQKASNEWALEYINEWREEVIIIKKNAGAKAAFDAYQELLPFELRTRIPIFITPNYISKHCTWQDNKEAKELWQVRKQIEEIMTPEIKDAQEKYKILVGLAK